MPNDLTGTPGSSISLGILATVSTCVPMPHASDYHPHMTCYFPVTEGMAGGPSPSNYHPHTRFHVPATNGKARLTCHATHLFLGPVTRELSKVNRYLWGATTVVSAKVWKARIFDKSALQHFTAFSHSRRGLLVCL